jgi:hydrogenase expression/formation protein HypE
VVTPRFFPGGDIGKLAVCGTVNDLAVSAAVPAYLSAGFIIEEGFPVEELERIVESMAREAESCGVEIATGDTKVVERGSCDGLFINTAGIGIVPGARSGIASAEAIEPGDRVLINGYIGDHGLAVTAARNSFELSTPLESDCAALNGLIEELLGSEAGNAVRFMRDPTRGGLATVLCELAETAGAGIEIEETAVPVREEVNGLCEMLGYDPLYVANEGKCVVVASAAAAEELLERMRRHPLGRRAAIIGQITEEHPRTVLLHTQAGGRRVVDMLAGGQLPRIC